MTKIPAPSVQALGLVKEGAIAAAVRYFIWHTDFNKEGVSQVDVTSSGEPLRGTWLFLQKQIQSARGIPLLALKTEQVTGPGMWLASRS